MPSHPRIGILGSLIKGLPDLWPLLNDETAFGHFFDMTKNNLVIPIANFMPGALLGYDFPENEFKSSRNWSTALTGVAHEVTKRILVEPFAGEVHS